MICRSPNTGTGCSFAARPRPHFAQELRLQTAMERGQLDGLISPHVSDHLHRCIYKSMLTIALVVERAKE